MKTFLLAVKLGFSEDEAMNKCNEREKLQLAL